MSGWFSFFGEPSDPGKDECDECQREPDWYRMGMTPRTLQRNLASTDPRRYLDHLVHLRQQYGERDEDDERTSETLEAFAKKKPRKKKGDTTVYFGHSPIGHLADVTWTFDPPHGSGGDEE